MKSNVCMKFGRNHVTNDMFIMTSRHTKEAAILAAILATLHRTKPIFKTVQGIVNSKSYVKFGRNQNTNAK